MLKQIVVPVDGNWILSAEGRFQLLGVIYHFYHFTVELGFT